MEQIELSVLNRTITYHRGPDISEVGSTWVADLFNMHVLHSSNAGELLRWPDENAGQIIQDETEILTGRLNLILGQ